MQHKSIHILSDQSSWINSFINDWMSGSPHLSLFHHAEQVPKGDVLFILSYSRILSAEFLQNHSHNVVVHASDLPRGKGMSPWTWQILHGENRIPMVLFEAQEALDAGPIYLKAMVEADGHELVNELRQLIGEATIMLCQDFLNAYPSVIEKGVCQQGESTFFRKRTPEDSQLDPDKTLREQMNLLRVVDNHNYPAFFEIDNVRYKLEITKM